MSSFTNTGRGISSPQLARSENRSPSPPPYSPLTPEHSIASPPLLADMQAPALPPPVPISESSNTDVIALRSALSVLQIQRLRSIRDVQVLNEQKQLALEDPEAFAKAISSGEIRTGSQQDLLSVLDTEHSPENTDKSNQPASCQEETENPEPGFGQIPRAQSVIRCPPINWAKYRVIGNALDALHEQRTRDPLAGDTPDYDTTKGPHLIAAPYSPWRDKLLHGKASQKS